MFLVLQCATERDGAHHRGGRGIQGPGAAQSHVSESIVFTYTRLCYAFLSICIYLSVDLSVSILGQRVFFSLFYAFALVLPSLL